MCTILRCSDQVPKGSVTPNRDEAPHLILFEPAVEVYERKGEHRCSLSCTIETLPTVMYSNIAKARESGR